jgi:hypothetical protein
MRHFILLGCILAVAGTSSYAQDMPPSRFSAATGLKIRNSTSRMFPHKGDSILLEAHSHIPLGADSVVLSSDRQRATIMASLECPELGNITVFQRADQRYVVKDNGEVVRQLPKRLTFRITASSLVQTSEKPLSLDVKAPLEEFLRKLTFVTKVYHRDTMDTRKLAPADVRHAGIPPEIAASERVYRASFDIGEVPIEDNVILEVNAEDGTPVTKFFLQLK